VIVTVVEDQDASGGKYGSSDVTLQFSTNEITEPNTAIFTHGEKIYCYFNNQQRTFALGSAATYSFHVAISFYPPTYKCDYHYFLKGKSEPPATIFSFHAAQKPLSPVLLRPVDNNNPNFKVSYNPGNPNPNVNKCTVQVTANTPNGNVMGDKVPQGGNIYTGPDISALNGLGNIVMTRTCTPISFNHHNSANDHSSIFDAVTVTYTSTASYEVTWVPPNTPPQSTSS